MWINLFPPAIGPGSSVTRSAPSACSPRLGFTRPGSGLPDFSRDSSLRSVQAGQAGQVPLSTSEEKHSSRRFIPDAQNANVLRLEIFKLLTTEGVSSNSNFGMLRLASTLLAAREKAVASGECLVANGDKVKTSPPLDWARDLRPRRRERREEFPIWNRLLFDWPLQPTRQFPQGTLAGRNAAVNSTLGSKMGREAGRQGEKDAEVKAKTV
jgi:hypothetical protein